MIKKALLVLEDGTVFNGRGFGETSQAWGELVFNTGMSGYVEAITDPSYTGQILMFTYPLIGNYGVCSEDFESDGARAAGVVVKELCTSPSNWRMEKKLDDFLKEEGIPGISGIDTRMLTRNIRTQGTAEALLAGGINVNVVPRIKEGRPNAIDLIQSKKISLVINTADNRNSTEDDMQIRRYALEYGIPYITTIQGVQAALEAINSKKHIQVMPLQELYIR